MHQIEQSDLEKILLAVEQGLEVVGDLRTSINENFEGVPLSEDDELEVRRVGNAYAGLHRAGRIVEDIMSGRKPLHREMHPAFANEIFMALGAVEPDDVARSAVEGRY